MTNQLWEVLRAAGETPSLPAGLRIYAIGDVHGRLDLLDKLLEKIQTDRTVRPAIRSVFVFLGDYIDRGPSSRQTIDRLMELAGDAECVFLRGNHEEIALRCLSDPGLFEHWMRLGGSDTLRSYGVTVRALTGASVAEMQASFHEAIPQSHLRFFRDLQNFFTCGDFFFVHAGVKPATLLSLQRPADLLWIRDEFLASRKDFGKIIVHGHTPVMNVEVKPNRINIDTGAFATNWLSCLSLEDGMLSVIDTRN